MDKEVKPGRFSPRFIIKRSGDKVPYQSSKIKNAIMAANMSEPDTSKRLVDEEIETIVNQITMQVYSTEEVFSVEQIQDMVEKLLSESGHFEVAKSYILYRKQHESVRKTKDTLLDYQKVVDGYLNVEDWRVKENSTVSYSLGGLILGNSGAVTANYWLNKVYDKEIADAHRDVRLHLHDLSLLAPYCAGWNLKQLIERGITGVGGRISSKPASHLSTLCNQMVNFLGIMQNEWAGKVKNGARVCVNP